MGEARTPLLRCVAAPAPSSLRIAGDPSPAGQGGVAAPFSSLCGLFPERVLVGGDDSPDLAGFGSSPDVAGYGRIWLLRGHREAAFGRWLPSPASVQHGVVGCAGFGPAAHSGGSGT